MWYTASCESKVQQFRAGIVCGVTCSYWEQFRNFFHHLFISYRILLHNSIIVPNSTKSKMYLFFISDLMRLCRQMHLRIWNRLQIYLLLLQRAWMYPLVRYSARQIMLYFFQCYTTNGVKLSGSISTCITECCSLMHLHALFHLLFCLVCLLVLAVKHRHHHIIVEPITNIWSWLFATFDCFTHHLGPSSLSHPRAYYTTSTVFKGICGIWPNCSRQGVWKKWLSAKTWMWLTFAVHIPNEAMV